MSNEILLFIKIFFSLIWLLGFFAILKPKITVNLTCKYLRWSMKLLGFEVDIKPTPKAKVICRIWNLFFLLLFSVFVYLIYSGKLK